MHSGNSTSSNHFDETKMYPNQLALKELERLEGISKNKKLSEWEIEEKWTLKISSLNCRSLKKHFLDILSDDLLLISDIICLQETWIEEETLVDNLQIPNYDLHLNSYGRGKGIAIYSKKGILRHEVDINEENLQLSKFSSSSIDIVVLYRSKNGNLQDLAQKLDSLLNTQKTQLVIGDFNFCFLENSSNSTKQYMKNKDFNQLIKEPTHIEGNLLDQAYVRDVRSYHKFSAKLHSKYYTDHKALEIMVKKSNESG